MATALEKIRQLDEQRAKILAEAKDEALAAANDAIDALNELGFSYQLVSKGGGKSSRKGSRQVNPDAVCGYCGFQTTPPHDKRAHRSQTEKRAFTDAELADAGMTKV